MVIITMSNEHDGDPQIFTLLLRKIATSSIYSVSSLVVPKMEDEFSGTDAGRNSK